MAKVNNGCVTIYMLLGYILMSSMSKKILAYHIARLKDKNKDVRIKSIQELIALSDREALPALEALYKSETDPEVRKIAQEAGLKIFNATRNAEE